MFSPSDLKKVLRRMPSLSSCELLDFHLFLFGKYSVVNSCLLGPGAAFAPNKTDSVVNSPTDTAMKPQERLPASCSESPTIRLHELNSDYTSPCSDHGSASAGIRHRYGRSRFGVADDVSAGTAPERVLSAG